MKNTKKNQRRDFIKNSLKAGVGAALLNTTSAQANQPLRTEKFIAKKKC